MKKNVMMRVASIMLVLVLLTSSVISGTFAKYTTSVSSTDTARVAQWGFGATTMDITGLFSQSYDLVNNSDVEVQSSDESDVIAPGTWGSAEFSFAYNEGTANAPEVDYNFTVSVDDSNCDATIANNSSIKWAVYDKGTDENDITWTDWGTMLNNIKLLSGDASGTEKYDAGSLPIEFTTADDIHVVAWKWSFDGNDVGDTALGNAATLASVTLKITITATQID